MIRFADCDKLGVAPSSLLLHIYMRFAVLREPSLLSDSPPRIAVLLGLNLHCCQTARLAGRIRLADCDKLGVAPMP